MAQSTAGPGAAAKGARTLAVAACLAVIAGTRDAKAWAVHTTAAKFPLANLQQAVAAAGRGGQRSAARGDRSSGLASLALAAAPALLAATFVRRSAGASSRRSTRRALQDPAAAYQAPGSQPQGAGAAPRPPPRGDAPRPSGLVSTETQAERQRMELWNMPKDIMPLIRDTRIKYRNADKQTMSRDLVVIKSKNANLAIEKASRLISNGAMKQGKLLRMMRYGRENFGRDIVSEMNREGMRAFKYRSGMRDLRNEDEFRRQEKRMPDRQRKRFRGIKKRWMEGRNAPKMRLVGKGKIRRKGR